MPERHRRTSIRNEPSVGELLSDPIAQALMRADRITVKEFVAIVTWLESALAVPHSSSRPQSIAVCDRQSEAGSAGAAEGTP